MKKVLVLSIVCVLLIGLSGCAYYKNTLVRLNADKATFSGMPLRLEGEKINAILDRQVYLGSDKKIPPLSDISVSEKTEDTENKVEITK